ncbi:MAG: T9SS C-terminal target domain-containing protein, partial [Calditrichaeota bacterium]
APLLATFYDTIYAEFRSDNTYEVTAIDPNGVATQFQGTYTATPSGVGNIFSITLQQTAPYAATVEGIFEINPAPLTGIKEVEQPIEGYRLLQNYPNPFNPSTNIAFRLAKRSQVSLKIFNALGEEVATLVDGVLPAGEHEVTFQANDLPSGIYFYRLKAGNFISARQMVLSR